MSSEKKKAYVSLGLVCIVSLILLEAYREYLSNEELQNYILYGSFSAKPLSFVLWVMPAVYIVECLGAQIVSDKKYLLLIAIATILLTLVSLLIKTSIIIKVLLIGGLILSILYIFVFTR